MEAIVTRAIVVGNVPIRERDVLVTLYTPEFGVIDARASGARLMTAKLSPHVDPVRRSIVRLTKKLGYVLADALTEDAWVEQRADPTIGSALVRSCAAIRAVGVREECGVATWHDMNRRFGDGTLTPKAVLKAFGYGGADRCARCDRPALLWYVPDHTPVCFDCSRGISERDIVVL